MKEHQYLTHEQIEDILQIGFALVPGPDGRLHVVTKHEVLIERSDVDRLVTAIKKEKGGAQ